MCRVARSPFDCHQSARQRVVATIFYCLSETLIVSLSAKTTQIQTLGSPSCRASVTALWGPKALDNIVDMDVTFEVERERTAIKRLLRLAFSFFQLINEGSDQAIARIPLRFPFI